MKSNFFLQKKFKITPVYRLTEWHQLSKYERQLIAGLYDEGEVYGAFQPVNENPAVTSKIAYRDVALLYLHLQHSNFIPRSYLLRHEDETRQTIAQLVLDDILAMEDDGQFVSGSNAVKAIYGESIFDDSVIPDHLSTLSMNAIKYALMLKDLDIKSMANRLYTYNTAPMDAASRLFSFGSGNMDGFLFSNAGVDAKNSLQQNWNYTQSSAGNWMFWIRNDKNGDSSGELQTYKLYISPQAKDLAENFGKIISIISASKAYSFKTGGTIKDLLRCDKMVVYFKNKTDIKSIAEELGNVLENCAVQGVPFTRQLDKKGILSAGADPLKKDILQSVEGGSWRSRVTEKLAAAIIQAQQNELNQSRSIEFIRAKLIAAGIDVHKWMPINDAI